MAALRYRDATGEGQWIDAALYESAFRILEYTTTFYGRKGVVRERGGIQHAGWPGGAFHTADGRWIAFTTPAQHLFERLCAMLGHPDLPKDPRFASHDARGANMAELLARVEAWFAARPFDEAVQALLCHDIPHSPIMSMADIFADPHYRERRTIIDVPSEVGPLPQPAVVPRLSATPGRVTHAGPPLGRDTDEILTGLLAMSAGEIAALRAEHVV
jgi:crotonobetainyl-CoA:carnitine CoA-transferase CaiB-like acyl-CoA transferase